MTATMTPSQKRQVAERIIAEAEGDAWCVEILGILGHDVAELDADIIKAPPEDLGAAQSWHPVSTFLMSQGEDLAARLLRRVVDLVHHSSDASVFFRAEGALAAITDCCNAKGLGKPLQEMLHQILDMAAHRFLDKHAFRAGRRPSLQAVPSAAPSAATGPEAGSEAGEGSGDWVEADSEDEAAGAGVGAGVAM